MSNFAKLKSTQDISNEAAVAYYAVKIKSELETATKAWRNVAELFAAASNEFGTDSHKFKALVKATNFSRSKVIKLVAIVNDKRLKAHEEKFQRLDAWTVLYEITTLTDSEFQKLVSSVEGKAVVTINDVNAARTKKTASEDPYKTVFSIQIDVNALKAQMFSGDEYQELNDAIETIQKTMKYVRVQETDLVDNDASRFYAELDREYKSEVRKAWNIAKRTFIAQCMCDDTIAEVKEDIQAQFNNGDYEAAFGFIGSDAFDQNKLMNNATQNVYKKREEKFGVKVLAVDAFANNDNQIEK